MNFSDLRRFLAFLCDLFLSYIISYALLSQEKFITFFDELFFYPVSTPLFYKHLYITLAFFLFYRFYSFLIFSISPSQVVWGLSLQGHNSLQKRFGAVVRLILLPLAPIFILINNIIHKDVADYLTGTQFKQRGGVFSVLLGMILLIATTVGAYFSPLLYKNSFLFSPTVNFKAKEEILVDKGKDFSLYQNYGSNTYKMMTFTDLDGGRFKVLPNYELSRKSGKLVFKPLISIWDSRLGVKGVFKISQRFDLLKLISNVRGNYPGFKKEYPSLDRNLEFAKGLGETFELDAPAKKELFELLSVSLLTNTFLLPRFVEKGRKHLFPYVYLKHELYELLGGDLAQTIDFVIRGKEIFIRTVSKDDFMEEFRERFFSLGQLTPIVYEVVWERSSWDKQINEDFAVNFYNKSKWGSVVQQEADFWEKEKIFNPLSIFDYISNNNADEQTIVAFEDYLKKFYYNGAKKSFKAPADYQNLYLASLQRVFIVWQYAKKQLDIPFDSATVKYISDIMKALKVKDKKFFGLEQVK
jgi:hypothetical protein